MICANMQTSFMHPPFGFALFYLRGIVSRDKVKTRDIYLGAIPWLILQLILVGMLIAFPEMVTYFLDAAKDIDLDKIDIQIPGAAGRRQWSGSASVLRSQHAAELRRSASGRTAGAGPAAARSVAAASSFN